MNPLKKQLAKLLTEPSDSTLVQIFRYLFSGGIAFAADFLLLYVLTDILHVYYLFSAVCSAAAGLVITYLFSILWIFDRRRLKNWKYEFLIFALIGVFGLCLTALFMYLFTSAAGLHYLLSKTATAVIVAGVNFVLKKMILFSGGGEIKERR